MGKAEQERMDFGCGDLPLFSGTGIPVDGPGSRPRRGDGKQGSFARCRVCLDTGTVVVSAGGAVRFCSCPAGQAARAAHKKAQERKEQRR